MSIWAQSGLRLEQAIRAGVVPSLAITGIVEEEQVTSRMQLPDESALTWAPNARLAFSLDRDWDGDFELVVRSLIDGVHARLAGANTAAGADVAGEQTAG